MMPGRATYWACLVALFLGTLLVGLSVASAQEVEVEVEAGIVFSGRNDTRIPGDSGTTLSLSDELATEPTPVFRLRGGLRRGERHLLSFLYAPLRLTARGSVDRDVVFQDATYPADSPLLAVYRFDSYRATYRYSFVQSNEWEVAAGVTAKIRSAETSLYGADAQRKTNVGFVPLANLHVEWRPGGRDFGVVLDADALAAPQGRAEDVLIAATWRVRDAVELRAGYRMLEGGADNDEVYSFAWLHYFVVGAKLTLGGS
jgi:hypothetical protein